MLKTKIHGIFVFTLVSIITLKLSLAHLNGVASAFVQSPFIDDGWGSFSNSISGSSPDDISPMFSQALVEKILSSETEPIVLASFGLNYPHQSEIPKVFQKIKKLPQELFDAIDEIIIKIFDTEAGQKLCIPVRGRIDLIQEITGVSLEASQKILHKCNGTSYAGEYKDDYLDNYLVKLQGRKAKTYHFVVLEEPLDIVSFTFGLGNETFFFFSKDDFNIETLTRSLIHEISITGETPLFTDDFKMQQMAFSGIQVDGFDSSKKCNLFKAVSRPSIATALESLRAIRFEMLVVRELSKKYNFRISSDLKKMNESIVNRCENTFLNFHNSFATSLISTFQNTDPLFYQLPELTTFCIDTKFDHYSSSPEDTKIDLDFLSSMFKNNILIKMNGSEQPLTLCQFLTTPAFGQFRKIRNFGPRPRFSRGFD